MQPMDILPLWVFFIAVLVVSTLWAEGGFRLGTWRRLKSKDDVSLDPLGTIVASVLGLLAFMLAFTFNVALNRFDDRRVAVLTEANNIGTTYLRTDFMDEPEQSQIKNLLREYVFVRQHGVGREDAEEVISKSERLQNQIWKLSVKVAKSNQNQPLSAIYIQSLNDTIDIHSKRVVLNKGARVPLSVWLVLFAVSMLSMASVGYYSGVSGNRSRFETMILTVTFAIVMLLVADLDRPGEGLIKTNQQPMIDLLKQIGPPKTN